MAAHLPLAFYRRPTLQVARDLLGKRLRHAGVTLEITEVEAYCPGDSAAHSRSGRTDRNAPMWGPPGRAYVYLCYGLHQMLNVVTEERGVGAAILVRACRPVRGLERVRARRGGRDGPVLLTGPGKVASALAVGAAQNHERLHVPGGLQCLDGPRPAALLRGPRVGIDFARPADRGAHWRFAVADSPWVTQRRSLRAWRRPWG